MLKPDYAKILNPAVVGVARQSAEFGASVGVHKMMHPAFSNALVELGADFSAHPVAAAYNAIVSRGFADVNEVGGAAVAPVGELVPANKTENKVTSIAEYSKRPEAKGRGPFDPKFTP